MKASSQFWDVHQQNLSAKGDTCRLDPENKGVKQDRDACLRLWLEQNQPPSPERHRITVRQRERGASPSLAGMDDSASYVPTVPEGLLPPPPPHTAGGS